MPLGVPVGVHRSVVDVVAEFAGDCAAISTGSSQS